MIGICPGVAPGGSVGPKAFSLRARDWLVMLATASLAAVLLVLFMFIQCARLIDFAIMHVTGYR
jgi:hypothetical protein